MALFKVTAAKPRLCQALGNSAPSQDAREQSEIDTLRAYYSALPHIEAGNKIWLEAGIISHSVRALAGGIGLLDLTPIYAARDTSAKIWSRDKKLLSLSNREEILHAKK